MPGLSYLAFAAGYRRISFVFIENGELATWHTSCIAARDATRATQLAREFIELLAPNVIVIEDIRTGTRKGRKAREALEAIRAEAERSRAQLLPIERERLFRTRHDEAAYLVRHYPELTDKVPSRRFHEREPHQMVLFEALALGHQALQGSTMLIASKM